MQQICFVNPVPKLLGLLTQSGLKPFPYAVQLQAKCNSPITLTLPVGSPTCNLQISKAALIAMISTNKDFPNSMVQEAFDLMPEPADGVTYSLPAGQTTTFQLVVGHFSSLLCSLFPASASLDRL